MFGQAGMNVGGISALSFDIFIDYALGKIGLKLKPAAAS